MCVPEPDVSPATPVHCLPACQGCRLPSLPCSLPLPQVALLLACVPAFRSTGKVWRLQDAVACPRLPNNLIISGTVHTQMASHFSGATKQWRWYGIEHSPCVQWLVATQAALTVVGNFTLWMGAFYVFQRASSAAEVTS